MKLIAKPTKDREREGMISRHRARSVPVSAVASKQRIATSGKQEGTIEMNRLVKLAGCLLAAMLAACENHPPEVAQTIPDQMLVRAETVHVALEGYFEDLGIVDRGAESGGARCRGGTQRGGHHD